MHIRCPPARRFSGPGAVYTPSWQRLVGVVYRCWVQGGPGQGAVDVYRSRRPKWRSWLPARGLLQTETSEIELPGFGDFKPCRRRRNSGATSGGDDRDARMEV
eukprot:61953-Pyramimonas_sp.AAC.1